MKIIISFILCFQCSLLFSQNIDSLLHLEEIFLVLKDGTFYKENEFSHKNFLLFNTVKTASGQKIRYHEISVIQTRRNLYVNVLNDQRRIYTFRKDLAKHKIQGKIHLFKKHKNSGPFQQKYQYYFTNKDYEIIKLDLQNLKDDLEARDLIENNEQIAVALSKLEKYDNVKKGHIALRILGPTIYGVFAIMYFRAMNDDLTKVASVGALLGSSIMLSTYFIDPNLLLKKAVKHYNASYE